MSKKNIAVLIGGVVILCALVVWLFVSGKVAVSWFGFGDTYPVTPRVCGSESISEYNEAIKIEETAARIKKLDPIVADIEQKTKFERDPNCQMMLFNYDVDKQDYEKAKQRLAGIKQLASEGSFPTTEVEMAQSIASMSRLLESTHEAPVPGRG